MIGLSGLMALTLVILAAPAGAVVFNIGGPEGDAGVDMSTTSGTNVYHGTVYFRRGTDWINAAPFFFNQDPDIPQANKVPQLHRWILGGNVGGPIIKDKLFAFLSYQHIHVSDQEIGDTLTDVPVGLNDTNRDAGGLATLANNSFGTTITSAQIDPVALALFNSPSLPGEPGKWLIPNDARNGTPPTVSNIFNAFLPGTGRFTADMAVADLDYNATGKDTIAGSTSPARSGHRTLPTPVFLISSISTPAPRFSPSSTPSRSNPISAPRRRWASFARRYGALTNKPSDPIPFPEDRRATPPSMSSVPVTFPAFPSTTCWATISLSAHPRPS